jgi:hypothetical protein
MFGYNVYSLLLNHHRIEMLITSMENLFLKSRCSYFRNGVGKLRRLFSIHSSKFQAKKRNSDTPEMKTERTVLFRFQCIARDLGQEESPTCSDEVYERNRENNFHEIYFITVCIE